MKLTGLVMVLCLLVSKASAVVTIDVAIVQGSYYTSNLATNLSNLGINVTLISEYSASSLAQYDAVIHYGNSYVNMAELESYVTNGGILVQTPWFWNNFSVTSNLALLTGSDSDQYSTAFPGITVNAPADALLNHVTFPAQGTVFNIGRENLRSFNTGVTNVATWSDNGTAFLGYKTLGSGKIIALNMHVVTSDTAYTVIDQPWAMQLIVNAIGSTIVVPEPSTYALLGAGLALLALGRFRRVRR